MQLELIPENNGKLIVSVFDFTGAWVQPYVNAGYPVLLWDLKCEGCLLERFDRLHWNIELCLEAYPNMQLYGFLFAPPCTDFAGSGARWWKEKDIPKQGYEPFESVTELSIGLVYACLALVDYWKPKGFWVLENPAGRIEKLIPELTFFRRLMFDPCDYGDPYTKRTILWGEFNPHLKQTPVEPIMYELNGKKGSYMWAKLGGKSERTKALRSETPKGFAHAFYEANQ